MTRLALCRQMVNNGLDNQPISDFALRPCCFHACFPSANRIVALGFNCIRLPFSLVELSEPRLPCIQEMVLHNASVPRPQACFLNHFRSFSGSLTYFTSQQEVLHANPDLVGLSPMEAGRAVSEAMSRSVAVGL